MTARSRFWRSAGVAALALALPATYLLRLSEEAVVEAGIARLGISPALAGWLLLNGIFLLGLAAAGLYALRRRRGPHGSLAGIALLLAAVGSLLQAANVAGLILSFGDAKRTYEALAGEADAGMAMLEEGRLVIEGPIGPRFMQSFLAIHAKTPVREIEITSEGGLVDQAKELARLVEDAGIRIEVPSYCMSACVMIAVASSRTLAQEDAVFGLHRSSPVADVTSKIGKWHSQQTDREMRDFLKQHGVPEALLVESDKHQGESIYELSGAEMLRHGAIDGLLEDQQTRAGD